VIRPQGGRARLSVGRAEVVGQGSAEVMVRAPGDGKD